MGVCPHCMHQLCLPPEADLGGEAGCSGTPFVTASLAEHGTSGAWLCPMAQSCGGQGGVSPTLITAPTCVCTLLPVQQIAALQLQCPPGKEEERCTPRQDPTHPARHPPLLPHGDAAATSSDMGKPHLMVPWHGCTWAHGTWQLASCSRALLALCCFDAWVMPQLDVKETK